MPRNDSSAVHAARHIAGGCGDQGRLYLAFGSIMLMAVLTTAVSFLKSETGVIGFVGGQESDLIRKSRAGYTAGAQTIRPDITLVRAAATIGIGCRAGRTQARQAA